MVSLATVAAVAAIPVAVLWLLPLASDAASLTVRLLSRAQSVPAASRIGRRERFLFLVPAHNEAGLIEACVRSLLGMESSRADIRVLVVADNCQDETAALARAAGGEVLERRDVGSPGKPRALEWALGRVPLAEVDAVVILDADSVVAPGFAGGLVEQSPLQDKAVQAYFDVSNADDSWLTRLASLFVAVRYDGQFQLKQRVGLNVVLTGNGMCLGTGILARSGWAADSLTEDLALYARLTAQGERIDFAPAAKLMSLEAGSLAQAGTQRRRWHVGRWIVLKQEALPLLLSSRVSWRQKLDALAELSMPGPVFHVTVAVLLALLLIGVGGSAARAVGSLFLLSTLPVLCWTLYALSRRPDRGALVRDLVKLPLYAVWRVGVAGLSLATGIRGVWKRSPR